MEYSYKNVREGTMCHIKFNNSSSPSIPAVIYNEEEKDFYTHESCREKPFAKMLSRKPLCKECFCPWYPNHKCTDKRHCSLCADDLCNCTNTVSEMLPRYDNWKCLVSSPFTKQVFGSYHLKTNHVILTTSGVLELRGCFLLDRKPNSIGLDCKQRSVFRYNLPPGSYVAYVFSNQADFRTPESAYLIGSADQKSIQKFLKSPKFLFSDLNIEFIPKGQDGHPILSSFHPSSADIYELLLNNNGTYTLYVSIDELPEPENKFYKMFRDYEDTLNHRSKITFKLTFTEDYKELRKTIIKDLYSCVCVMSRFDLVEDEPMSYDEVDLSFKFSKLEIGELQALDDDEAETPAPTPVAQELAPETKIPEMQVPEVPSLSLEKGLTTDMFNQAIDKTNVGVGLNSSRTIRHVPTPSGIATAIDLTVTTPNVEDIDYNLNYSLWPHCNVWQPVNFNRITGIVTPEFNLRTRLAMQFFTHYRTDVVWKIVCKPPLFQAERFWVGWNPAISGTPLSYSEANNLVGFEWNASEENEIYVISPYSSLDYMNSVDAFDQLGHLVIKSVTGLITEAGLPNPLPISVYCAPLNMQLFTPSPVSLNPQEVDMTYSALLPFTGDNQSYAITHSGDISAVVHSMNNSATSSITLGTEIVYDKNPATVDILNPTVTPSPTTITAEGFGADDVGSVRVYSTEPFTIPGVTVAATLVDLTSIQSAEGMSFTVQNLIIGELLPDFTVDDELVVNTNLGEWLNFDATVIVRPEFATTATSITTVPPTSIRVGVLAPPNVTITAASLRETGELQMLGYKYTRDFAYNHKIYGSMTDHTERLDAQWSLLNTLPMATPTDQLVFDVFTPTQDYCNFDRNRHLMFSKAPNVKFTATSNPSSNISIRITETSSPTAIPFEEALQLPGVEWDIKSGPIVFQPYWRSKYPGEYSTLEDISQPLYLQLDVLGGVVGTAFEISSWYNTKSLHYHHLVGPTPTDPTTKFVVHGELQSGEAHVTQLSQVVPQSHEGSAAASERRWNYVASVPVSAGTGVAYIPITSSLFGKWASHHAGRFAKWRGELRLKFMINNSFLVNGNYHFVHVNSVPTGPIAAAKFVDLLGDISHSVSGAPGEATELAVQWRTRHPFLPIHSNLTSDNNGFIAVIIPLIAPQPTDSVSQTNITIYSDISGVEFSLPCSTDYGGGFAPVTVTQVARA